MLQLNVQPYASDALEDAMRLAQTKALNSYSWSDCINYLNYTWNDIYNQIALVDEGYYSKTIRINKKLTKLPLCVKSTIKVYAAQSPNRYNREIFRASGYNDLNGWNTYHISGFDLYCPDAERRAVWLNYLPQPPQIFFTRDNRDPKIYADPALFPTKKLPEEVQLIDPSTGALIDEYEEVIYNLYKIQLKDATPEQIAKGEYVLYERDGSPPKEVRVVYSHRNTSLNLEDYDVTEMIERAYAQNEKGWKIVSFIADYPYLFITFKHTITDEYYSGFYRDLTRDDEWVEYNPFAFTGRNSNVEYLQCKWNDKTGLGVILNDWNDMEQYLDDQQVPQVRPRIKELGWTPDTLLIYPAPEAYRWLVARLADKFASLNESNTMGVQKELTEAEWAFKNFLGKDKSAWQRIDNVNGPTIGDWL